jgi:glycerophosphoryl diester phosphodiesterase
MNRSLTVPLLGLLIASVTPQSMAAAGIKPVENVQLGPRPYFLADDLEEGPLKEKLLSCQEGPFKKSTLSIGHRGAPMQFPEHTKESYMAAARMGAGVIECDVTFTKDKELVCRHSQCDLHTTTNILATPLAEKCSVPFEPAKFNDKGELVQPAQVQCCTSDITLAEFQTLEGKMDAGNPNATSVAEYMDATPAWRTDRYSSRGTLMTHKESIELFKALGIQMTPELKGASVDMPFDGMSQGDYAQKMIDEYKAAGVPADQVWPQSFNLEDVKYWIEHEADFGQQGVYLDDRDETAGMDFRDPSTWKPSMQELKDQGVQVLAPPLWMLVDVENDKIVPSLYAKEAKKAGLKLIAWSLERSGKLNEGGGWYYQSLNSDNPPVKGGKGVIDREGDVLTLVDVLAQEVGVIGIFSDWPATVTYYDNCMNP